MNYNTVYGRKLNKGEQSFNRMRNLSLGALGGIAAAPAIAAVAGGGAPSSFGIGAANTGAWSSAVPALASTSASAPLVVGMSAAPKAMTFGNMLKLGELGVGAATNLLGQRSQNKALNRQQQIEQQNYGEQMQLAREQEAYRRSEADRVARQEEARWQAEEAYRAKQVAADEEERAYSRRLMDEREARRAPKRAAGQAALLRLQDLLRLGRG